MKKLLIAAIFVLTAMMPASAQTESAQNSAIINETADVLSGKIADKKTENEFPQQQQPNKYVRPTADKRFKRYLNKTIGTGLIGVGIGASIQQFAENPPEWDKNGKGFARRLGSNFGENVIQETVAYGIEEALKLDSKFYKSVKRDFGSRLQNAFLSGVTARTLSGKRVFNPAPIIGSYAANLVSTKVWYPKRYSYKDGLRQGTQSALFTIAFGLLNEFLFNRK